VVSQQCILSGYSLEHWLANSCIPSLVIARKQSSSCTTASPWRLFLPPKESYNTNCFFNVCVSSDQSLQAMRGLVCGDARACDSSIDTLS
jgi:hypothetical protein